MLAEALQGGRIAGAYLAGVAVPLQRRRLQRLALSKVKCLVLRVSPRAESCPVPKPVA